MDVFEAIHSSVRSLKPCAITEQGSKKTLSEIVYYENYDDRVLDRLDTDVRYLWSCFTDLGGARMDGDCRDAWGVDRLCETFPGSDRPG